MKKLTIAATLMLAALAVSGLCACGAQGSSSQSSGEPTSSTQTPQKQGSPALSEAYAALMDADLANSRIEVTYFEEQDELSLVIGGEESAVDEVFDVIDKAVAGKDIGTFTVYIETGWLKGITHDDEVEHLVAMMPELSKRIGELPCNSAKSIGFGRMINEMADNDMYDASWTNILKKCEGLRLGVWGGTWAFSHYSPEELKNLAYVTRLELGDRYDGGNFTNLPNVQELVFTSGDDEDDKEDAAKHGFNWKSDMRDHANDLADLESLERVIFFPDLDSWTVDGDYYEFLMAVQATCPNALTNEPGTGWDGDINKLIPISSIDIKGALGEENYQKARKDLLRVAAKASFVKGQDFTLKSGEPKLNGPTLVYVMGNPYKLEWSDYSQFSSGGDVLLSEFDGTGVTLPDESFQHDFLVYAYPTYELVGQYESGTEAYATIVNVQVYDLKNKVKYEPVVVDVVQPPETRILDSDEKEASEPNKDAVAAYVVGLS